MADEIEGGWGALPRDRFDGIEREEGHFGLQAKAGVEVCDKRVADKIRGRASNANMAAVKKAKSFAVIACFATKPDGGC
jgi:hypothetical protein